MWFRVSVGGGVRCNDGFCVGMLESVADGVVDCGEGFSTFCGFGRGGGT